MSVLLPSFACVTNNPFEAFWLMNSKAEALRSKSTGEHELGKLCRGGRRTMSNHWHHPGGMVDDTRESHETFTTVYGHVHGRNGMFMVERHTVFTG